jgi:O-glycosyl hydrolase
VAFGDSFIWADATSGETANRAATRAVEQTRSARIDEILEQYSMIRTRRAALAQSVERFSERIVLKPWNRGATVVGFGRRLNRKARAIVGKKEGRPEAAFATLSGEDGL